MIHLSQINALKDFCSLILCGHHEDVFRRCIECMENADDEYGGIPDVLCVLSGHDRDPDDPFGNIADDDKQLVKSQSYLISSDAGAPCLEDFFWFIENIKAARGLDFTIDKDKFSDDDCIIEWLAELSAQLEGLYIVDFYGTGDEYNFTIMNQDDCEKAMNAFKKMTVHIDGHYYKSFIITNDFKG